MDRSWINSRLFSKEHVEGVNEFMSFVSRRFNDNEEMLCPCRRCLNRARKRKGQVEDHLYIHGMASTYTTWIHHGEPLEIVLQQNEANVDENTSLNEDLGMNVDEEDDRDEGIRVMVEELYAAEDEGTGKRSMFAVLLEEMKQELYPGAHYTRFSFVVKLLHIKSFYRISNVAFTALLKLLSSAFPDCSIPASYQEAKRLIRALGFGYNSIHCMAMPSGNEEEDLGGPLSRLLGLIQDVCIVESGPHLDSKHAYVIVRHVKFATKKAGKKASKAMEDAGKGTRNTSSESPVAATDSGDETTECDLEVDDVAISDHFDKMPPYLSGESSARKEGSRIKPGQWGPQTSERGLGSKDAKSDMEKREKTNQDMAPGETNRYATRRQQIRGDNQGLSQGRSPQDPRRNGNEGRYPVNDNQRPLQQHNQPLPRFDQGRIPQDPRRNERGIRIPLNNNQRQFQPLNQPAEPASGPATKSFGIFSTPKPATSELRRTNGAYTSKPANPDLPKSYGIFSSPRRESDDKSS